jgi:hypothetical protein
VIGPLARTVTDLAIALDVTVGRDTADRATAVLDTLAIPGFQASLHKDALGGKRLGILRNYMTGTDADIADSIRSTARAMAALGAEVIEVNIPNLDSLVAGTGVIPFEFKWDLMDYLAREPSAPVHSLRDILDRGLHHDALDGTFRIRDSISTRDSDPYKAALAKQAVLRGRLVALFDSLRIDALVYPTMQRRPVFVGEAQQGSTCSLSAQSGLPAISMPAGFTNDGLPVGLEMMAKPFEDVKLVTMAYAFEQSSGGVRRRAPLTTPVLRNGRAPAAQVFTARAGLAVASLRFDALRNELHYSVTVPPTSARTSQAVALQRTDSVGGSKRTRVIQRLAGPGLATATGVIPLSELDRRALIEGRLGILHVTTDTPLGHSAPVQRAIR